MFSVDDASVSAIRQALEEGGEFAAAIELRRRFPGIQDNEQARCMATRIASWPSASELQARIALLRRDRVGKRR
jgi:hypothetical protein